MRVLIAFILLSGTPCVAQQYIQPTKQQSTKQQSKQLPSPLPLPLPQPAPSYIIKKRQQTNSKYNPANSNRDHVDMHGRTAEDRESRTQDQYILQRLPDGVLPPGTTVFVPSTKKKRP